MQEFNEPQVDYDSPWKQALEEYFEPFLGLCFPQVHSLIDWSRPPDSLDKELQQIMREAESGKLIADKLFKVWQLGGEETWILIHLTSPPFEKGGF